MTHNRFSTLHRPDGPEIFKFISNVWINYQFATWQLADIPGNNTKTITHRIKPMMLIKRDYRKHTFPHSWTLTTKGAEWAEWYLNEVKPSQNASIGLTEETGQQYIKEREIRCSL